jgi:DNA recombination protein RmuC
MEFIYVFVALASGLALGFVIGRLAGKNSTVAALTENRLLKESLAKTESAQTALAQQIQSEFKNIANEVLVSGSRHVHEDAQKQLNTLLSPLQSKLGEFQNRLEQTATAQGRDSAALKEQIRALTDPQQERERRGAAARRCSEGRCEVAGQLGRNGA